mmetsp:Transcript_28378/g.46618  ORF Transcript_28378/g.46618 Transcript_28378/m.46618 type:complete len:237 (+) Transcript_28378:48-758(+)|eukprot:CAMPEP_0202687040 /NCGR_PEP_ID=MMETSP1385-20130828/2752_1 /ASSEMBLY_ACC=CAM_ASM_000861 /TAXON_ID=933848 /ORGANISM="Elphidium margaritaceum" /LENGTH=236 /DNA_ID=CAMNT_0049341753 /DNA_START=34 /DNA_END=744 /DNA_ORIENTATION=-
MTSSSSSKDDKLTMSEKTEIASSSSPSSNTKNLTFIDKKPKSLVTTMPSEAEEKSSTRNTRGIPRAAHLPNPYDVIYKNQQEQYLKEVEDVLGKYRLMESQLVKQKVGKIDQQKEMKKNVEACRYLQQKRDNDDSEIQTQFEVSDQLYSYGSIKEYENVAIWLGADVMMEFPIDEAIEFLQRRIQMSDERITALQTDIDFTRKQINTVEVNRSRVYNAGVKIKRAREAAAAASNKK